MARVQSTRHRWDNTPEGSVCIGEALDASGNVVARVRLSASWEVKDDLKHYHGSGGIKVVEEDAERMARELAENPPPACR